MTHTWLWFLYRTWVLFVFLVCSSIVAFSSQSYPCGGVQCELLSLHLGLGFSPGRFSPAGALAFASPAFRLLAPGIPPTRHLQA